MIANIRKCLTILININNNNNNSKNNNNYHNNNKINKIVVV